MIPTGTTQGECLLQFSSTGDSEEAIAKSALRSAFSDYGRLLLDLGHRLPQGLLKRLILQPQLFHRAASIKKKRTSLRGLQNIDG